VIYHSTMSYTRCCSTSCLTTRHDLVPVTRLFFLTEGGS